MWPLKHVTQETDKRRHMLTVLLSIPHQYNPETVFLYKPLVLEDCGNERRAVSKTLFRYLLTILSCSVSISHFVRFSWHRAEKGTTARHKQKQVASQTSQQVSR